ncbi:M50 family metallopeptidase [Brachybacterium sp. AOP25-B2-12]|uniref:M50 family metallopeptidase n=1 Tax=Brachybacterium sp. AOP25-B2-12 TaxID=3457710 RepID=UPI004033C436
MTIALYALGVLLVAIGIGISIALHELGHLTAAKAFGVRVTQYMIGFGPTVWSRRRGETEYGVKLLPLGGYVRMIGMYPPHKGEAPGTIREDSTGLFQQMAHDAKEFEASQYGPEEQSRTFVALSVPRKLVVMLAGPVMNLLIAVVLLAVLLCGFGLPAVTNQVSSVSQCVLPADAPEGTACEGRPEAPALAAGIRPDDVIVSIDGTENPTWEAVSTAIRGAGDRTVPVVLERDGQRLTVQATPIVDARPVYGADGEVEREADGSVRTEQVGFLGVSGTRDLVPRPVTEVPGAVWDTFVGTAKIVVTLPVRLVDVAVAAFGDAPRDPNGPIGVVGVSRLAGEVVSADQPGFEVKEKLFTLVSMLASLNMALFVFNLIPLMPLDGGHVAGALLEGARRRIARWRGRPDPGPVDMSRMLPVTNVVAIAFLAMTLLLVYADIVRPVTLFGP